MVFAVLVTVATAGLILFLIHRIFVRPWISPLRVLPGPPAAGFLRGHLDAISKADTGVVYEEWIARYGHTIRYKALFNEDRLVSVDLKALNHIIGRTDVYQRAGLVRAFLSAVSGNGILVAEGDDHKNQRRILNPAFGPARVRDLSGFFFHKAYELRDIWTKATATADGVARVDALSWFSKCALDIIGLAGFSYSFDSLSRPAEDPDELGRAISILFKPRGLPIFAFLRYYFPAIRFIYRNAEHSKMMAAGDVVQRVSKELLAEKEAAALAAAEGDEKAPPGRDIISLLVRAKLAGTSSGGMDEATMLAQIPTFLIAGHETTSSSLAWAMYALCVHPEVQTRLRAELATVTLPSVEAVASMEPADEKTVTALNKLPYFEAFVKEFMRLYTPVPSTFRLAVKDDVIPFGTPVLGRDGKMHSEIRISKGDSVFIPLLIVNRSKELWGEDAHEFIPDRHLPPNGPPAATDAVPGVYGHTLAFHGGPHSCIGYRFAVLEMKVILAVLLNDFSFELAVPASELGKRTNVTTRPLVLSELHKGGQLPVLVRPIRGKA